MMKLLSPTLILAVCVAPNMVTAHQCSVVLESSQRSQLLAVYVQATQRFPQGLRTWAVPAVLMGEFLSEPLDMDRFASALTAEEVLYIATHTATSPQKAGAQWTSDLARASYRTAEMIHALSSKKGFSLQELRVKFQKAGTDHERLELTQKQLKLLRKKLRNEPFATLLKRTGTAIKEGFHLPHVKSTSAIYRDALEKAQEDEARLLSSTLMAMVFMHVEEELVDFPSISRQVTQLLSFTRVL